MNIQPLMYVHVSNVLLTKFSYFDILEENFDKSFVFSFPSLNMYFHPLNRLLILSCQFV